jgi:hypothetical protein
MRGGERALGIIGGCILCGHKCCDAGGGLQDFR